MMNSTSSSMSAFAFVGRRPILDSADRGPRTSGPAVRDSQTRLTSLLVPPAAGM